MPWKKSYSKLWGRLDMFSDNPWKRNWVKFRRINRSYLGKGWQWWKSGEELSKQRNSVCEDPGAGEGTEQLRTWMKTRVADQRANRRVARDKMREGSHWMFLSRGLTWFVLYNHSQCSVESELERTREQVGRTTWEKGEEEKMRTCNPVSTGRQYSRD